MKVTLRLDDNLALKAMRIAKAQGATIETLLERALGSLLAEMPERSRRARRRLRLPVSKTGGGTLPGVNLDSSSALLDRMEIIKVP